MTRKRLPGRMMMGLVFLFLYAPILVLIVFSFNSSKSRSQWSGFTFDWYVQLFQDELIMSSLYTTLAVAILAGIIATVAGTLAAVGINAMKRRPKKMMLAVNNIPVINPDIITGVSLMLLFVMFYHISGLELGFGTLLLAHITFNIPYVILSVMPKLRQLNRHLYEAALDLGATPFTAFFKVILPEIMPGIINGLIIAFTMSFDDFVISYFTAGSGTQTLAMTIYSMIRKRITPKINALSTLMFLFVLVLLILINVRQIRDMKKESVRQLTEEDRT